MDMSIKQPFCNTSKAAPRLDVAVGSAQLRVEKGRLSAGKTEGGHQCVARESESIDKLLNEDPATPLVTVSEAGAARLRILVVEDSSNLRRLYDMVLSQWPMAPRVTLVDGAIKAIMLLERQPTDLLVLDLGLAGIDGFELVRILKRDKKHAKLFIVVVSGMEQLEMMKRGGLPPGVLVFGKPVPFTKLLAVATDIYERKRERKNEKNTGR